MTGTVKRTILLSTKKLCLAKIGYQPNCHVMYIASDWSSAKFCLADKFTIKQYFSAEQLYETWIMV